jgi:uncharacterized protein Smg (DUF494 family)
MYQRLMDLLVLLMDEYGGHSLRSEQMDSISKDLIRRGFTEQEINTAFFWLHQRSERKTDSSAVQAHVVQEPADTSFRMLNAFERRCFSTAAFGYLTHLLNLRLISLRDLELIIERVLMLDLVPAGLDDVKMLAQSVLFEDASIGWISHRLASPFGQSETYH